MGNNITKMDSIKESNTVNRRKISSNKLNKDSSPYTEVENSKIQEMILESSSDSSQERSKKIIRFYRAR